MTSGASAEGVVTREKPLAVVAGGTDRGQVIERLYAEHKQSVFTLALRYGRGDIGWAEDVTHDVFVDLFDVIDRLADTDDLGRWLYRVTTNRCLNKLKRQQWWDRPLVQLVLRATTSGRATDPETVTIARGDLRSAFETVNALPPKERVVFYMRHVDGFDQSAIARTLGFSKGYVSKLLQRARQVLERQGWEVGDEP
jgi:RNA polymerase sigma-70 factor (ECF subfamily)